MYVFDTSPLILLASANYLDLVTALDDECCLPECVYEEVVTAGIEAGHPDARRVEQAIQDDHFRVAPNPETPLVDQLAHADTLSDADVAVLALAADCAGIAVIDEQYGRTVAETEGIQTRGSAYVVLNAQQSGLIDAVTARTAIDALLDAGWYCAPDLYANIRDKVDEIDRRTDDR